MSRRYVPSTFVRSKEEQDRLLKAIGEGFKDRTNTNKYLKAREAKRRLIRELESLVLEMTAIIAKRYKKNTGICVDLEKLFELGNRGLEKAIKLWIKEDKKRPYKFATYAAWFIRAEMHKELGLPVNPEKYE